MLCRAQSSLTMQFKIGSFGVEKKCSKWPDPY
jgi:hypothetical protein